MQSVSLIIDLCSFVFIFDVVFEMYAVYSAGACLAALPVSAFFVTLGALATRYFSRRLARKIPIHKCVHSLCSMCYANRFYVYVIETHLMNR